MGFSDESLFIPVQNKCVPYWPDELTTKEMGNYLVTCESEREATDYKVRVLEIALQAKVNPDRTPTSDLTVLARLRVWS